MPAIISRRAVSIDVGLLAANLLADGYAVLDNVLGMHAVQCVREGILSLDRAGALKPGKVQHGLDQSTESASRSDRIAFIQPEGCADEALAAYLLLADGLRVQLSSDERLVKRLDGALDGCNYMCAIYPGGGGHYVKHRDALPYRAGRKLTVGVDLESGEDARGTCRSGAKCCVHARPPTHACCHSRHRPCERQVIFYMNPDWEPSHGGELRLWPETRSADGPVQGAAVRIAPRADR